MKIAGSAGERRPQGRLTGVPGAATTPNHAIMETR